MVLTSSDINYLLNIPLGKVQDWKDNKDTTLVPITTPTFNASRTYVVDTLGVGNQFAITGRLTGKYYDIQNRIWSIKELANGAQNDTVIPFRSPFVNSVFAVFVGGSLVDLRKQGNISTNTSTEANKLKDTNALFTTWNVQTGSGTLTNYPDLVKNLLTGEVSEIASGGVTAFALTLKDDIFPVSGGSGVPYALTATITVKILNTEFNWELPGLSYCDYKINVVQAI